MDILVTFPDGTTELRAANSPCVRDFESPPRAPHVAKHADIEGWCLDGRTVREIEDCRGSRFLWAWRLTGHTEEPYTLTGEWQKVQIETVDEQIERLTRERDAAEKRIADLRAWAVDAEATSLDGVHVASDEAARERYRARRCAFARVVAKIDGKDG